MTKSYLSRAAFSRRHIVKLGLLSPALATLPLSQIAALAQISKIETAADILAKARLSVRRLPGLAENIRPQSFEEAYQVQDALLMRLGGRGGYKASFASPEMKPVTGMIRSQLPKRDILKSGAIIKTPPSGLMVVEGEIAYRLRKDLPARDTIYSDDEVLDAVDAMPGIEILWTRFEDIATAGGYALLADLAYNGSYVTGEPIKDWRQRLPENPPMTLLLDGKPAFQSDAATHSSNDLNTKPLIWLANEGTRSLGGLKKGEVISVGNYTRGIPFTVPVKVDVIVGDMGSIVAELFS